jgi:hypothetical protein
MVHYGTVSDTLFVSYVTMMIFTVGWRKYVSWEGRATMPITLIIYLDVSLYFQFRIHSQLLSHRDGLWYKDGLCAIVPK